MPGASTITTSDYTVGHNQNVSKLRIFKYNISTAADITNNSTIKENKTHNCYCNGGKCNGSRIRIIDENDMKELLLVLEGQHKSLSNELIHLAREEWVKFYSFPRLFLTDNTNENQQDAFVLQPSLFHNNNLPPIIYFTTKLSEDSKPAIGLPRCLQTYCRWKISSITPNSIRDCISFMGIEVLRPSSTDTLYLGSWCKHMLTNEFSQLENWRKVNHYPGSFHLGRKDKLWFRLKTAALKYGAEEFGSFHPTTFILPRDYDDLSESWQNSPSKLFIMKPPASARGNGIKVINDISQIPVSALECIVQPDGSPSKKSTMIVQQYISNPCLLENGQKFDLRVYVLLSSVDPLRIYVYKEGLVRFASAKYTSEEDGIIDQYMHLTNYFINKNNQEYKINNDCDSLNGGKWTLSRFWQYLREHHKQVNVQQLWENIEDIIVKTIVCCEGPMFRLSHQNCKNDYTAYELFGFDILLDENFKPWILEVNITPSLKSESDLDATVKYNVIKDMFNLVGYNLPPDSSQNDLGNLTGSRLFFDVRLYTENLTKRDKLKHMKCQRQFKSNIQINKPSELQDDLEYWMDDRLNNNSNQEKGPTIVNSSRTEPNATCHVPNNHAMSIDRENQVGNSVNFRSKSSFDILQDLTQNDLRVLMLSEDELPRCGNFKRVFPSSNSSKYLKYFDKPRYYNLLLDAWEQKYKDNRIEGICRLSNLAIFLD